MKVSGLCEVQEVVEACFDDEEESRSKKRKGISQYTVRAEPILSSPQTLTSGKRPILAGKQSCTAHITVIRVCIILMQALGSGGDQLAEKARGKFYSLSLSLSLSFSLP